jgi:hypothetical protein
MDVIETVSVAVVLVFGVVFILAAGWQIWAEIRAELDRRKPLSGVRDAWHGDVYEPATGTGAYYTPKSVADELNEVK